MKKIISVVALDPRAATFYAQEIRGLFGKYADVRVYSVRDGSAMGVLPRADLFTISTDAYGSAEEVARHIPIDCQSMGLEVAYRWSTLQKLEKIPKGTRALYVNMTDTMAREAIAQLEQLGVNHIHFIPFYPNAILEESVDLAVTPDEVRYVPKEVTNILNIGHRSCTSGMMIEIALRLDMEPLLETEEFKNYFRSMATNNYSFDLMYARSQRLESQFHILMEILDTGLIGVNEKGEIFACNKNAADIARISKDLVLGKRGEEVLPFIPFNHVLKEKEAMSAKVIKLNGNNVSIAVVPVLRQQECIGAFATMQRFNEVEQKQNELRSQLLQKGHCAKYSFHDVIGKSTSIQRTKEILKRMAETESPVLLIGETGTGKELFAHAIHLASRRKNKPFLAINVAAMPENLLESELFGYEEGAFTGAKKGGEPSLFEFAHTGTLFLDEVEGMSSALQVKLLRVLQEQEIMRVGGNRIIHIDVRIIAATNESLEQKVSDGSFRKDLYYRLNTLPVMIPPLREREGDLELLLEQFQKELQSHFTLSKEVLHYLKQYSWPGNIRELHNIAEYFNYTGHSIITMEDLPPTILHSTFIDTFPPNTSPSPLSLPNKTVFYESKTTSPSAPQPQNSTSLPITSHSFPSFQQEEDYLWFILEQLFYAEKHRESIGREKLLHIAKDQHLHLSQYKIRELLKHMEEEGFLIIGKGRGGTHLTKKGYNKWLNRLL